MEGAAAAVVLPINTQARMRERKKKKSLPRSVAEFWERVAGGGGGRHLFESSTGSEHMCSGEGEETAGN